MLKCRSLLLSVPLSRSLRSPAEHCPTSPAVPMFPPSRRGGEEADTCHLHDCHCLYKYSILKSIMKAKNKTHTMHQNAKHHLRGLGSNRVSGQRLKDSLLRTRVPVHPSAVLHTFVCRRGNGTIKTKALHPEDFSC